MPEPTMPLYGPTGDVVTRVVVPPFPDAWSDHARTVCPCGGIPTSPPAKADEVAPE